MDGNQIHIVTYQTWNRTKKFGKIDLVFSVSGIFKVIFANCW